MNVLKIDIEFNKKAMEARIQFSLQCSICSVEILFTGSKRQFSDVIFENRNQRAFLMEENQKSWGKTKRENAFERNKQGKKESK